MEYKGSNSWSDTDSEESGSSSSSSRETARPVERVIPAPTSRALLDGVIFNRQGRERSATEVARAVEPGFGATEQMLPPVVAPQEQMRAFPPLGHELALEDDEDDESDEDNSAATVPRHDAASFVETQPAMNRAEHRPILPASLVELSTEPTEAASSMPVPVTSAPTASAFAAGESFAAAPAMEASEGTSGDSEGSRTETFASPAVAASEFSTPIPVAGGGEGRFPPPPERPVPGMPGPDERGYEWAAHASRGLRNNTYHPQSAQAVEFVTRQTVEAAKQEMKRKMLAQSLMLLAVGWYLGHRPVKKLRNEVSNLQETSKQQQAELTNLSYQHQEAQARIAEQNRQIEQFTRPEAAPVPVPFQSEQIKATRPNVQVIEAQRPQAEQPVKLVNENGEEIELQPGQRFELAGGYRVVVDDHNRIVWSPTGDEYKRDRMHERPPSPFGSQDARYTQGAGSFSGGGGGGSFAGQPMASPGSSQSVAPQYSLPMNDAGQTPNEEAQHLLPPPKPNPVATALASPWLWLGVGVLLLAFFAAATI